MLIIIESIQKGGFCSSTSRACVSNGDAGAEIEQNVTVQTSSSQWVTMEGLNNQELNSIINYIPDVIYRLDNAGKITFANNAVTSFGYSVEELIGTNILELVHPEDRNKATYRINERRTGDRSTKSFKLRLLTKKTITDPADSTLKAIDQNSFFLVSAEGLYRSEKPAAKSFIGT